MKSRFTHQLKILLKTQHMVASVLGGFVETRSLLLTLALAVGVWHLRRPIRCMLNRTKISWFLDDIRSWVYGKLDLQLFNNAGSSEAAVAMTHSDNCYYISNMRTIDKMCRSNAVRISRFWRINIKNELEH